MHMKLYKKLCVDVNTQKMYIVKKKFVDFADKYFLLRVLILKQTAFKVFQTITIRYEQ
jgi:hypothetical protein